MVAQPLFQIMNIGATGDEFGIDHQFPMQGNIGVDPFNHGLS